MNVLNMKEEQVELSNLNDGKGGKKKIMEKKFSPIQ